MNQATHKSSAKTNAEYLKRYAHCPVCDGDETEGGSMEVDTITCSQEVNCLGCGSTWTDIYTLTSYELTTDQREGES